MPALRGGGGYCFRIQLDILSSAIGDIVSFDLRVFGEGASIEDPAGTLLAGTPPFDFRVFAGEAHPATWN
jgi:hypothetical protein